MDGPDIRPTGYLNRISRFHLFVALLLTAQAYLFMITAYFRDLNIKERLEELAQVNIVYSQKCCCWKCFNNYLKFIQFFPLCITQRLWHTTNKILGVLRIVSNVHIPRKYYNSLFRIKLYAVPSKELNPCGRVWCLPRCVSRRCGTSWSTYWRWWTGRSRARTSPLWISGVTSQC